ncbi:MAG: hypothetical protein ACJ72R_04180 [Nitrososphaeraceae archaeon]
MMQKQASISLLLEEEKKKKKNMKLLDSRHHRGVCIKLYDPLQ